jgi:hypothetical protein
MYVKRTFSSSFWVGSLDAASTGTDADLAIKRFDPIEIARQLWDETLTARGLTPRRAINRATVRPQDMKFEGGSKAVAIAEGLIRIGLEAHLFHSREAQASLT